MRGLNRQKARTVLCYLRGKAKQGMSMTHKGKRNASWAVCALWMALIFAMSAATGEVSGEQSGLLVRLLTALLPKGILLDEAVLSALETLVRKAAHMAEYAVLFCLYRHALRLSGVKRAGIIALALSVGYAVTDEIHQAFVPGRGPSPIDVMIDGCGALLGWAALRLCKRLIRSYRQRSAPDGE